jgi:hypothetical protein
MTPISTIRLTHRRGRTIPTTTISTNSTTRIPKTLNRTVQTIPTIFRNLTNSNQSFRQMTRTMTVTNRFPSTRSTQIRTIRMVLTPTGTSLTLRTRQTHSTPKTTPAVVMIQTIQTSTRTPQMTMPRRRCEGARTRYRCRSCPQTCRRRMKIRRTKRAGAMMRRSIHSCRARRRGRRLWHPQSCHHRSRLTPPLAETRRRRRLLNPREVAPPRRGCPSLPGRRSVTRSWRPGRPHRCPDCER